MGRKLLRLEFLVLFIVLASSLLFRVTNLNLIEFKTDEAVNLLLSARPAIHHSLPPGGTVSSVGILNPPLFNYLLAPLSFLTLDPKVFSLLIALANSIAIVFFYLIIKKYYGQIIAFTSTMLFALSPWAIIYSRKIWTQDLLVPFFIIFIYSLHKIVQDKKKSFWTLFMLSSLFLIQLHQIVIIFIGLVLVFMRIEKIRFDYKFVLIGLILGIIPFIPYIGYEINNGYPDFKTAFSSQNKLSNHRSLELFLRPLQITGQGNINFELGPDLDPLIKKFPFMKETRAIFYFEYIMVILGAFISLKKFKSLRLLSIPGIILPFVYFFIKIDPFMHYYIIILPLLFIFLGIAFEFLFKQKNNLVKSISFIIFLSLITSSLYFNFSFFKLLKDQGYFQGDYGASLSNSETRVKYRKYDELFLYQFIPLGYYFGYNPFAKMIYGEISPKTIPLLEANLRNSNNIQAQNELLAYYTKDPPNLKTLDVLKKKNNEISQYSTIYNIVLEDYMAKNYKKQYVSSQFDFMFFYPQHWKVHEKDNIKIEGDNLIAIIRKGKSEPNFAFKIKDKLLILGQEGEKIVCKSNNHICGVYYLFKSYTVEISIKNLNEEGIQREVNAFDELLRSIRFI